MVERRRLIVVREGAEETFEAEALPLSIGGRDADEIRLPVDGTAGAEVSITRSLVSPRLLGGRAVEVCSLAAASLTDMAEMLATVRSVLSCPEPVAPTT